MKISEREKAKDLQLMDQLTRNSKMTMEDVLELDKLIKKGVWAKIKKELD